jgi:hypothetical protein
MTAITTAPRHSADALGGWTHLMEAWRRSADEARDDRLVTASVGVLGAVMGVAAALFARGTTAAVWAGLVTLCVTPGCALVCWLSTRERLTRVVAVLAASLTWTILVTSVLAWLQVTMLGVLLMATAGVGGIGSAVFLIAQLARYLKRPPVVALVDKGENPSGATAVDAASRPRFFAVSRWLVHPVFFLTSSLVAAAGLLAIAVTQARGHAVGNYGLLPLLGVSFLVAVVVTIGVLVLALRFVRTAWPAAVMALGLLLVELNGTPMWLDATPLANWVYKHFGVVDYFVNGGALRDPLDIYQQWPGFFAAASGLVRLSGRGPLAYSNWAQLFFEALNAVVLFAIARRFSHGHRVVPYVTVLLFETANWEGQFYYSPQTTALLLALLFQFFLLSLVEPARLRRWFERLRWLSVPPPLEIKGENRIDVVGMAARVVGLIAIFGAIVITHQLSPYVVFVGVAGLWVLGVLRHPLVVLILAITLLAYASLHPQAIDKNQLLTGFSLSNATGSASLLPASPEQALASVVAKTISLGFWCATAICVISYRRRLRIVAIPVILAATPLSFILVTNYDGEAIYRAFLFSSPWCALIIARRLADLVRVPMLRWTAVGFWALYAALGSAQAQDFGLYPQLHVPPADISASAYFLNHAPPNTELVTAAGQDFPSRLNGRYVLHDVTQTANDPSLDSLPAFGRNKLDHVSPRALAQVVANLAGGSGYLAIAPSMEPYVDYYGVYAPGTLSALVPRLEASRYWRVWYHHDGVVIFQAIPGGRT